MNGLIVRAEYNDQTTHSGILAMAVVCGKSIAINYVMFVISFAMNVVKPAHIHSYWYEEIARIDPAQRNSHPPCAYISVLNKSSQRLCSSLTLCISLSRNFLVPLPQWYTSAKVQSTLFTDIEQSRLQRSGNW